MIRKLKPLHQVLAENPNYNFSDQVFYFQDGSQIHTSWIDLFLFKKEIEQSKYLFPESFYEPLERWKPKYEEEYFYIDSMQGIDSCIWVNNIVDNRRLDVGNVFRTYLEAETRLPFVLKAYRGE